MIKSRKFTKGVRLKGTDSAATLDGEIRNDKTAKRTKVYHDTDGVDSAGEREVITSDQTQELSNKTIDGTSATGNNTITADADNISYDNGVSGLTATEVKSAIDELKTGLDDQNDASEINYDPAGNPETSALFVQAALDDTGTASQAAQDAADAAQTAADNAQGDIDAHELLTEAHGATGAVMGTTNTQTVQNKTLDSSNTISGSIETPSRSDVKQDTEANLITYAGSAADGQFVFATDTQKMYQIIDNALAPVGGGGATAFEINQVAHGLAVGNGVYHNGSSFVKAQADDADTLAYYTIVEVIDVDNFIAADFGRIEVPAHGYTIGEYYFQSESVAGDATSTEPSSGFSNPLFYVEDANTLQVKVYRPNAIDGGLDLDQLNDVSVPAPTDGQVLAYDNGNARWEAKDTVSDASDVVYDNSGTNLFSTDAQSALTELDARSNGNSSDIATAQTDISELEDAVPINHLQGNNSSAEVDIGDWDTYVDAAGENPVNGTSGVANITFTRNTTTPLRGSGDFKFSKDAVNRQGEGASCAFTINNADKAQKMIISFDYDASDTDYVDGDIRFSVYDTFNNQLIRINGEDLMGGKGTHYAQFQTDSVSAVYRLIAHVSSTNAAAYDIYFDNFSVGPQVITHGTIVTDWEEFTPTGTWTTNTSYQGKYRRVGDTIEVDTFITLSGAPNAIALEVVLPIGLSMDTTKLAAGTSIRQEFKMSGYIRTAASGNSAISGADYVDSDNIKPLFGVPTDAVDISFASITSTAPHTFASGDTISLKYTVPIQGWSSNAKMSEDFSGRDVVAVGRGNGATVITGGTTNIDFTKTRDTTASFDGTTFTVPETGDYTINGMIRFTGAVDTRIAIYVDGSFRWEISSANNVYHSFSTSVQLDKDAAVTIRSVSGGTLQNDANRHHITIKKDNSAQTILENETVAARYITGDTVTNSFPNATSNVIVFETKDFDTHNAMNASTGRYTVPVSGKYNVTAQYSSSAALTVSAWLLDIVKNNNSVHRALNNSAGGEVTTVITTVLELEKGDVIDIKAYQNSGSTQTISADPIRTTFSIARIK